MLRGSVALRSNEDWLTAPCRFDSCPYSNFSDYEVWLRATGISFVARFVFYLFLVASPTRLRWKRLLRPLSRSVVATRTWDRVFQLLELLFLFDLYEAISNMLSPSVRTLRPAELAVLYPVFGDSLPYHRIRIDERAHFGPRRYGIVYVSFHTINSWGPLTPALLVHECVHIWQYIHRGALYIPRALAAQRTRAGYDYGGPQGLRHARTLDDFNYEQMATIIEDGYRLGAGLPLRYARVELMSYGDRQAYARFSGEIRAASWPCVY